MLTKKSLYFYKSDFLSFSQTIDGKEFYQYPVEKGNTLYSISKKFAIDLNELVSLNPEAEKGLKVGDILNIPKESDSTVVAKPIEIQKELMREIDIVQQRPQEIIHRNLGFCVETSS